MTETHYFWRSLTALLGARPLGRKMVRSSDFCKLFAVTIPYLQRLHSLVNRVCEPLIASIVRHFRFSPSPGFILLPPDQLA